MEIINLDTGAAWPGGTPLIEVVTVPTMFVVAVVGLAEPDDIAAHVRRFVVLAKDRNDAARIVACEQAIDPTDRVLVDEAKAACVDVGTQVVPSVLIGPWLAAYGVYDVRQASG